MPATPAGPPSIPEQLPHGVEHVATKACGCWDSDEWAELFAEMLDEKGEHVAAGYVRSMTARDPAGIGGVRTEPPTGVIDLHQVTSLAAGRRRHRR